MQYSQILENSLYLLALLNPASKVMFLSTYDPHLSRKQIFELSWKSSAAALMMLVVLAGAGEIVLSKIFRVELYSLRITGGLVVFLIGWTAIREGRFMQKRPFFVPGAIYWVQQQRGSPQTPKYIQGELR